MAYILQTVMLICFFACYSVTSIYDFHMLQLNSYKPERHIMWMRRNLVKGYLYRHIILVLNLIAALIFYQAAFIIASVVFVLQFMINRPKKAKKPLVYTGRVKRMLFTNLILVLIFASLSFLFSYRLQILILTLIPALSPFLALLSNTINAPVEKSINRWYINDAKKIISSMPNLIVIGITGSYGKTSTKHFLSRALSSKYNVLITPESYNTTLGVVRTIREQMKPLHNVFICEMGAKNIGDIKEICDIVKPRYGVITSIGPQHLETFKSIDNVLKTKFELADSIPQDGAVFLNYDNVYIKNYKHNGKTVPYSADGDTTCDYYANGVSVSPQGSAFNVIFPDKTEYSFDTKLLGLHNVQNIVASIAVADYLGVSRDDAALNIRRLEGVPHRLQLINRGNLTIIDDAYNSNQNGAKAALEVLSMFDGYKILITPGMIELGEMQDKYNFEFGAQAGGVCDHVILVGKKQTQSILNGLKSVNYVDDKITIADKFEEAFSKVDAVSPKGVHKIVLLENDLPDNY